MFSWGHFLRELQGAVAERPAPPPPPPRKARGVIMSMPPSPLVITMIMMLVTSCDMGATCERVGEGVTGCIWWAVPRRQPLTLSHQLLVTSI